MLSVKSVTGATLQVEITDLSGQQLKMREGPYVGKLVEIVGIAPQFRVASLVIRLEDGQCMIVNPDWVDGNGKEVKG